MEENNNISYRNSLLWILLSTSDERGGDHIDLWDGKSMTGFGSFFRAAFNIVIPSIWSNLIKAKKIYSFQ